MKSRGFHVRRQAPVGPYVVDFVCFARKLVIEADGGQHNAASGIARDGRRDAFLKAEGFRVLRFWNNDIDDNLDGVMSAIAEALNNSTPPG
jgi:very-short-patch-repair endonuclease